MAEKFIVNCVIPDPVVQGPEDKFRTRNLYLGIMQPGNKLVETVLARITEQALQLAGLLTDILSGLVLQQVGLIGRGRRAEGLDDLEATTTFVHHVDADATRAVDLPAYEHGTKIPRGTQKANQELLNR